MTELPVLAAIGEQIVGRDVPRPSGQLSGHAGGLPFEEIVHDMLVERLGDRAWRHFEALNEALISSKERLAWRSPPSDFVFGPPDVHFLAKRGESAVRQWALDALFEEKQNDTAESIIFSDEDDQFFSPLVSFVDVKTQTLRTKAQPPNIISARKIADVSQIVISEGLAVHFEILYLGVKFAELDRGNQPVLVAKDARAISLMKIQPSELYINWAAATQIQFHPSTVDQSYSDSPSAWMREFLDIYCRSLERRLKSQNDEVERIRELLARP